jgi:hypothetical protein
MSPVCMVVIAVNVMRKYCGIVFGCDSILIPSLNVSFIYMNNR